VFFGAGVQDGVFGDEDVSGGDGEGWFECRK
jgi:hypothetical protein